MTRRIFSWCGVLCVALGIVAEATPTIKSGHRCKPTTAPVTTCTAPGNAIPNDWCEGELPKEGSNYYGEVSCQTEANKDCEEDPPNKMNDCGDIWLCTVNRGSFYNPGGCTHFPTKPPCSRMWGDCTYVAP